jgi:SHS2 domain-containing protein
MKNYEIIDTTADIGIRAFGAELSDVYTNAALGMFSLITDIDKIAERLSREVTVSAPDPETLLVVWLNELIFIFDTEMLLFSRFKIVELNKTHLKAHCSGEKVDLSRHKMKMGIKSATYHKLKVESLKEDGYQAEVILDI